jgi:AraC family transcriptional regulator
MIKEETQNCYIQGVNRVLDFINIHYADELTLERLAKEAYFSPFHFHKIFKGIVGETHQKYINRIRLERAILRMDGEKTLTEIAMETGFSTPSHFAQAFRELYKISPRLYRERKKQKRSKISTVFPLEPVHTFNINSDVGELTIREFPAIRIAYVRHIGDYNFTVGFAWKTLMQWASRKKILGKNTLRLSLSYDDPELTPERKLRLDACVTIPDGVEAEGPVSIRTIEGGLFAVFEYRGPNSGLDAFYDSVYGKFLPASGKNLCDAPSLRVHRESPLDQIRGNCDNELRVPLSDR